MGQLRRYFVADMDGESAECLVDALTLEKAKELHLEWCRYTFDREDPPEINHVYEVLHSPQKEEALGWDHPHLKLLLTKTKHPTDV